MRARVPLTVAALTALAFPGTASAGVAPEVRYGSCDIEVTNGTAACLVVLPPNPNGEVGTDTWSGWGSYDISCSVSGFTWRSAGGVGYDWARFPHGADVCRVTIQASGGTTSGYVF